MPAHRIPDPRITLSFYKYHRLSDPVAFRDALFLAWDGMGVLGRVYVAGEGINAQVSVPSARLSEFKAHLEGIDFLQGVRLNFAVEQDDRSFLKLKIKVRSRIVADGITDATFDATRVGTHLRAGEFNAMLEDPHALVVDARNRYESEIGHFPGAIRPDVITFRESLKAIERKLEGRTDKKVVMYCTGGIRCEKASAWLRHRGFRDVFQLEGGIIDYLRQVREQGLENRFQGRNFVFDGRMSERISGDIVSACHQCGSACDTHANCANDACHMLLIQCPACAERMGGCCSEPCLETVRLPMEIQVSRRKGYKAPLRYSRPLGQEDGAGKGAPGR